VLLAGAVTAAALYRWADGQSVGQSLIGGAADTLGISDMYGSATNTDIVTGQNLNMTAEERASLERWTTRRKTAHGLAVRAEIVLRCSAGCSNSQVARDLRLTNTTVGKWRARFVAGGVAALLDEPRSGAPRRITDDQVEVVVVKTLESTPRNATHWSVRSMAQATGMSRQAVHRIWKAFGLQPHRTETFKLSTDL
jgi:transposase